MGLAGLREVVSEDFFNEVTFEKSPRENKRVDKEKYEEENINRGDQVVEGPPQLSVAGGVSEMEGCGLGGRAMRTGQGRADLSGD